MFAGEYDFVVDLDGTLIVYDFEIPEEPCVRDQDSE